MTLLIFIDVVVFGTYLWIGFAMFLTEYILENTFKRSAFLALTWPREMIRDMCTKEDENSD